MSEFAAAPDLSRFFAPRSVALVGATDDRSRFAGKVLLRLRDFGFQGTIYPVNPRLREVAGLPCHASVRDLPQAPDHVGIVVPAPQVLGILEDCAARGARFATVYTGGFAESATDEGRAMQAQITALARRTGMRVMGPNCNGLVNFIDGFAMTTSGTVATRRPPGRVAVVSQSGGGGQVNVMWRAQEAGVGISYEVSCGNSADLTVLDFIEFMIDDAATDVILVFVEHIPDGARLLRLAARAAAREKPIVMLKLGRTEAGSRAAASHTGAMAGVDAVCDAALAQAGILRVDDCHELYEVAMMLATRRWPRGRRAAATTISGGNGVLLVDHGAALGIDFPDYTEATRARLAELLPRLGSAGNPTDVTNAAVGKPGLFSEVISAVTADDNIDVAVPIFTLAPASDVRQAVEAAQAATKPVAVLWTGGCSDDPAFTVSSIVAAGVPAYRNTLGCLKAVRAAMRYGEFLRGRTRPEAVPQCPPGMDLQRARALLDQASRIGPTPASQAREGGVPTLHPAGAAQGSAPRGADGAAILTERVSKQLLACCGLAVTREALATDAEQAVELAASFGGPVAIKIESPDIAHKTDAGAIRLNVLGASAVREAFAGVIAAARAARPQARIDGVLVQAMAAPGVELMLGLARDPVFGPIAVVGLGGVHVEVLRDLAWRVAPVAHREAQAMLRELRGYRLLEGVRGAAPSDIDALCDAIVRVSWLGHQLADRITELDINPLFVYPQGVRVVDALITTTGRSEATH